ncbi:MAG: hypothetical protein K1X81_05235 [Bacteroidia bacterium]|nr:hypothetical protein [Bacteroidia bacterium]
MKLYSIQICLFAFVFALIGNANRVAAQDTLRSDNIVLISTPSVVIANAIKEKTLPNPEVPATKAPELSYTGVPGLQLGIKPSINPVKPMMIGSNSYTKLKNNYTKLGFGNYSSPLIEFYMNSLRSRSYHGNVFFKHYSAKGDEAYNNFSDNQLGGEVKRFFKKSTLSMQGNYQRNGFRAYGLPDSITDKNNPFFIDPAKRILSTFNLSGKLSNVQHDSASTRYDIGLNYYLFNGSSYSSDPKEHDLLIDGNFSKLIQGVHHVELYTGLNVVSNSYPFTRTYFRFNPVYNLSIQSNLHMKLGMNTTYYKDDANSGFYPFLVVDTRYELIPKKTISFVGITGDVIKNTNRTVLGENRFTDPIGSVNTALIPNPSQPVFTNTRYTQMYFGLKGNLSSTLGYLVRYNYRTAKDMLFFVNDYSYSRGANFTAVAADAKITTITAEINYQFSEKIRLAATGNIYGYKVSGLSKAPQLPTSDLRLNGTYNIGDKFLLKTDIYFMNQRYAYIADPISSPAGKFEKMKSLLDLNMGIDYRYNKTVSLFLNVNNITANRYMRWYNYQVYGINVHGGLAFTL